MDSFKEEFVHELLGNVKKLLPIQAPLPSFIHNNILLSFEHYSFLEAVVHAQETYHAKAFMDEDYYLDAIDRGRISIQDIIHVLHQHFDQEVLQSETILYKKTRQELYLKLLTSPPQFLPKINVEWILSHETDKELFHHKADRDHLRKMEYKISEYFLKIGHKKLNPLFQKWQSTPNLHQNIIDYLQHLENNESFFLNECQKNKHRLMIRIVWSVCLYLIHHHPEALKEQNKKRKSYRFRDYVIENFSENYDDFLNPFIIRMLSSYMDQGLSYWPSPNKENGLWKHFEEFFLSKATVLPPYYEAASKTMIEYQSSGYSMNQIIWSELRRTPYSESKWQSYINELVLDLRGWSGMIHRLEQEPHLAPVKCPKLHFEEYVAIRLILERAAVEYYLKMHQLHFSDRTLLERNKEDYHPEENAFLLLETLLALELDPEEIINLNAQELHFISELLHDFPLIKRKKIYQEAFERHLTAKGIHALKISSQKQKPKINSRFQVFHCMDDREEALRRYLEESDVGIETFGTVGFFGVDMNYVKINHPRKIPQCPVVIKPRKIVKEVPKPSFKMKYLKAQKASINLGRAQLINYYSGRTLIRGFFSTLFLGIPSLIPLSLRILSPAKAKALDNFVSRFFVTQIETDIAIDHKKDYQSTELNHGYSYEEMKDIVVTILKGMGLTKNFAKMVIVLGHGSSSLNNAHIMAYGCGACGGNPGSPNARAFAKMINMPEVRSLVKEAGIEIPDDTYFLGAYHDTCTDEVIYQDIDLIPISHLDDYKLFSDTMRKALAQNAMERSRWFKNAPLKITPKKALRHVKSRSLSLAEPRPEYGHSNVAFAVIGRRELTRGLFLDRRCFLVSYDPTIDNEEGTILKGLLGASIPVAAGISLDYFFSFMDSDRYGCGSKLPLNLSSLIGVISGASSDLRLGLPRQSVDIHEPVRLTVLIECEHKKLLKLIQGAPRQLTLIKNSWLFVFTIDPITKEFHQFIDGEFKPYNDSVETIIPEVNNSSEYVQNKKRESLEFVFTKIERLK
jgi:hypothetical protein